MRCGARRRRIKAACDAEGVSMVDAAMVWMKLHSKLQVGPHSPPPECSDPDSRPL